MPMGYHASSLCSNIPIKHQLHFSLRLGNCTVAPSSAVSLMHAENLECKHDLYYYNVAIHSWYISFKKISTNSVNFYQ